MSGRLATCGRLASGLPLPPENFRAPTLSFAVYRYAGQPVNLPRLVIRLPELLRSSAIPLKG